jgi:hypothetical protein
LFIAEILLLGVKHGSPVIRSPGEPFNKSWSGH